MKAISVKQPFAEQLASGKKRIEYRTWKTNHRGPLLIVSSKEPREGGEGLPCGVAVCVVDLVDVTGEEGDYEWHVARPRRVEEMPIRGFAAIYNVPDERIRYRTATAADIARAKTAKRAARAPKAARSAYIIRVDGWDGEEAASSWSVAHRRACALAIEHGGVARAYKGCGHVEAFAITPGAAARLG